MKKVEFVPLLNSHIETLQAIDAELKDLEDFNVDLNNSIVNITVQID
ncbi:MAG: hypothetical protein J5632_02650 [Bacteroidales bacterium]|nr:hypothetical protein [Bacteroidales bacterium]